MPHAFLDQPFVQQLSYWDVVERQTDVGHSDTNQERPDGHWQRVSQRRLGLCDPCCIGINERVVNDVDGIRNHAQKAADPGAQTCAHFAACTNVDDQWEDEYDAQCFIETIFPQVGRATNAWHSQRGDDNGTA